MSTARRRRSFAGETPTNPPRAPPASSTVRAVRDTRPSRAQRLRRVPPRRGRRVHQSRRFEGAENDSNTARSHDGSNGGEDGDGSGGGRRLGADPIDVPATPSSVAPSGVQPRRAPVVRSLLKSGGVALAGRTSATAGPSHQTPRRDGRGAARATGADPNEASGKGTLATHVAAARGNRAVLVALLEAGASAGAKDRDKQTALHLAARSGDVETVRAAAAIRREAADQGRGFRILGQVEAHRRGVGASRRRRGVSRRSRRRGRYAHGPRAGRVRAVAPRLSERSATQLRSRPERKRSAAEVVQALSQSAAADAEEADAAEAASALRELVCAGAREQAGGGSRRGGAQAAGPNPKGNVRGFHRGVEDLVHRRGGVQRGWRAGDKGTSRQTHCEGRRLRGIGAASTARVAFAAGSARPVADAERRGERGEGVATGERAGPRERRRVRGRAGPGGSRDPTRRFVDVSVIPSRRRLAYIWRTPAPTRAFGGIKTNKRVIAQTRASIRGLDRWGARLSRRRRRAPSPSSPTRALRR